MKSYKLQPFQATDRSPVFSLLNGLPALYPGSYAWLDRRLDRVLAGKAECTLALSHSHVIGILIETPKGKRRAKLSTIYVDLGCRGRRVGSTLIDHHTRNWIEREIDEVSLTVPLPDPTKTILACNRHGFQPMCIERNRYGEGRDEAILIWRLRDAKKHNLDVDKASSIA